MEATFKVKTIEESGQAYREYIAEHVANIAKAWVLVEKQLTGISWLDEFTMSLIDNRVKTHDASKLSCEEREGYRRNFSPCEQDAEHGWTPEGVQKGFDLAWLHHKNRNDHHPEFWILNGRPLEMSFPAMFEMLLDWTAMSLKFKDTPGKFWEKKRYWLPLHEETKKVVDRWIQVFDEAIR